MGTLSKERGRQAKRSAAHGMGSVPCPARRRRGTIAGMTPALPLPYVPLAPVPAGYDDRTECPRRRTR